MSFRRLEIDLDVLYYCRNRFEKQRNLEACMVNAGMDPSKPYDLKHDMDNRMSVISQQERYAIDPGIVAQVVPQSEWPSEFASVDVVGQIRESVERELRGCGSGSLREYQQAYPN